jgi:GNAT superfamily N-acetyltransferase
MNILGRINSYVRKRLAYSNIPMTRISGVEKSSGEPLAVLYAGPVSQMPFVSNIFLSPDVSTSDVGKHSTTSIHKVARSNGCQLVMVVQDAAARSLLPSRGYTLPLWITKFADLSTSPFETTNSSLKKDLRLIRKHELRCEQTTSEDDLEFFWERMYVPYTTNQYGEQALVVPKEEFSAQVEAGTLELFFVIHDGRRIAGGVLDVSGEIPHFRYLGILDADPEARKIGALPALYAFQLDWARNEGYSEANLGGIRPLLKDGVLQFKKKFNVRLLNSAGKRILYVNPVIIDDAVLAGLVSTPLIRIERGKLVATIFESAECEADTPDTLWQYNGELLAGLDRVERIQL